MSIKVAELTFLEHFSKRYGIPAPRYLPGTASRAEIKAALEAWGGRLPRLAYLVEHISSQMEVYTAITYNTRFLGPSLTVSHQRGDRHRGGAGGTAGHPAGGHLPGP